MTEIGCLTLFLVDDALIEGAQDFSGLDFGFLIELDGRSGASPFSPTQAYLPCVSLISCGSSRDKSSPRVMLQNRSSGEEGINPFPHHVTTPTENARAAVESLQSELEKSTREHKKTISAISSMMAEHKAKIEALELAQALLRSRIEAIQNGEEPNKFAGRRVSFARTDV